MNDRAGRSRKAVAPVLATLLMIAVAVAMSVIIFMWSQGFLSNTSTSTTGQQSSQNTAAQSSMSLESVSFGITTKGIQSLDVAATAGFTSAADTSSGKNYIQLLVRNVGAVSVKIGSVLIEGELIPQTVYSGDGTDEDSFAAFPNSSVGQHAFVYYYDKATALQTGSSAEIPAGGFARINVRFAWATSRNYSFKAGSVAGTFVQISTLSPTS